jgi:hypothetical protein
MVESRMPYRKRWRARSLLLVTSLWVVGSSIAPAAEAERDGASHWSFVPPARPGLPAVRQNEWVRNPVDSFILARLEHEKLTPSDRASRATLLRRLSLDLTGLPPTPAERRAFLTDRRADAWEQVVDRLLASPHFGERLALEWLDAARYADTFGYHEDYHRDVWAWREWVIDAFNAGKPFDTFTREQLAGDLLPQSTNAQKVATGFHRLHGVTSSGIPEEYRVEYVLDRVKAVASAWLGLTLGCAQCHDHKYDPISQRDFYSFYAFFNNIEDPAIMGNSGGNVEPLIPLERPEDRTASTRLDRELERLEAGQERLLAATPAGLVSEWEDAHRERQRTLPPPEAKLLLHAALDQTVSEGVTGTGATRRGPAGVAFEFDGETHVELGDTVTLEHDQPFSYGAWIHPAGGGGILSRIDDKNDFRGWDLFHTGTHLEAHIVHRWPQNALHCRTQEPVPPGSWYHVFLTYDGSGRAEGMTLYVNGKSVAVEVTRNALKGTIATDKPFRIGSRNPSAQFKGSIADVRVYGGQLAANEVATLAVPQHALLARPAATRTPEQAAAVQHAFLKDSNANYQELVSRLETTRAERSALTKKMSLTTVMVMREMAKPRKTFLLNRGQYDQPGEEVSAAVPARLPAFPADAPSNRLGLAEWLLQPQHPLTSRVAVNRMWQMLFGTGLVKTQEDFGTQGEQPSHPRLLDWLASEFVESGWNTKALVRLLVTSETYRQSSRRHPSHTTRDPANRLLARGPRFRLAAEFIRDNALATSGLLVRTLGGPSVKPYQPPGLWIESHTRSYTQDTGQKLYRRSLYTYWKRAAPPPNMLAFDAPNRETCTARRQRTNTPAMALVLMNDPTFVEAARHLAARLLRSTTVSEAKRLQQAFEIVLGRAPEAREVDQLLALHKEQVDLYQAAPAEARAVLGVGDSPRDERLDASEHAAWTTVASVLLSLDETITKE